MPKRKITQRLFGSVFAKLLAVVLVTGFGIHLAVGAFFWYFRNEAGREYHKTLAHYLALVVSEIDDPPDPEKAAALAAAGAFNLRYIAPQGGFSTREDVPERLPARMRQFQPQPGVRAGFARGRILVELEQPRGRYLFELGPEMAELEVAKPVILLLALVTLILAAAYFTLRRILKPIVRLKEGVLQVSRGNLDHRIPLHGHAGSEGGAGCERAQGGFREKHLRGADEFRDLARAFNEMTARIRDMLEARERLMLDVSHELRSPLTRLRVALEFLPDDATREGLREDVAEMESIITAILENARIRYRQGKIERRPMDLAQVVAGLLPEFERRPPGVRAADLPAGVVCSLNPELIRTVLKNLVDNALKHTPPESPPVEIVLEKKPPSALIRVTDHGTGIAPEDLPHIFEPFYRADRSRSRTTGGYGLGLSLCKAVVEAHEGRIGVASTPQKGTTVTITLPLFAA